MAETAELEEEVDKRVKKENNLHTPCGGYKSYVWKYFGFRKDGKKLLKDIAICRACRCEIRYCGNTSNLSAHLKRRHDVQGVEKVQPSSSPLTTFFPEKFSHSSKRAKNLSKAIAFFICTDIRPYCVVEKEGFRYLLDTLEPRYSIPSRQHFSESLIPKLYAKVRDRVIQELQEAQRVAVTCDGWTSCTTESFITVTCHFINHEWEMQNYVLQTRVLAETHSGVSIGHVLRAACEEWGLSNKAPALLTATDRLLGRVRRIVSFFHRSAIATTVYKEKQKLLNLPCHKLKADVKTRWNSSFEMLERFLEQQPAVTATLLDNKLRKGGSEIRTLTEGDLSAAEQVVSLLAPLKAATTLMCEEKQPTVSIIGPLRTKLLTHFEYTQDDTPLIKDMKRVMAEDLRERYVNEEPFLLRAAALDPRFKKLQFLSDERRNQTFECIAEEAAQLKEQRVETPPVSKKTKVLDDLFGDSFSTEDQCARKKTSKELANDEIRKYRDIASLSLGGKVLQWWKAHQAEFPLLADLAQTYLCIPGTSVPSERVFSTAGDIVRSERSVLSSEHVDQLIFLKKNLSKCTIESIEL
uniref:BED-type domain-containing protein n=1 Tax=Cyprinodon variegatus TaxID=28743 RepID=A0A3Q2CX90_CYPVA